MLTRGDAKFMATEEERRKGRGGGREEDTSKYQNCHGIDNLVLQH